MPDLADELAAGLMQPGAIPTSGPELIRWAGGRDALTRQLSGLEHYPRKADYPGNPAALEADRRRWNSARRYVQRASDEGKAGKQRRGTTAAGRRLTPAQRSRMTAAKVQNNWRQMFRRGMRVRIKARVTVGTPTPGRKADTRTRELPAAGPAVLIPPGVELNGVLLNAAQGDSGQAAFDLQVAFAEAYGMPDDMQIDDVLELTVWPEGEPEPD